MAAPWGYDGAMIGSMKARWCHRGSTTEAPRKHHGSTIERRRHPWRHHGVRWKSRGGTASPWTHTGGTGDPPRAHHRGTMHPPQRRHGPTTGAQWTHHEGTTKAPREHHGVTRNTSWRHHGGITEAPWRHYGSTTNDTTGSGQKHHCSSHGGAMGTRQRSTM